MKHVGRPLLVMLLSCHNRSPWVFTSDDSTTLLMRQEEACLTHTSKIGVSIPSLPPFTTVTLYLCCCIVRYSSPNTSQPEVAATVAALPPCVRPVSRCSRSLCCGWWAEASHHEQIKQSSASSSDSHRAAWPDGWRLKKFVGRANLFVWRRTLAFGHLTLSTSADWADYLDLLFFIERLEWLSHFSNLLSKDLILRNTAYS